MTNRTMTNIRRKTTTRLRALEVPEAFTMATLSAASLETYRRNRRDARRLDRKVVAILAALAAGACGGHVSDTSPVAPPSRCEDYAAKLTTAGCDLPYDLEDAVTDPATCPAYAAKIDHCQQDAQCTDDMSVRMTEACHGHAPPPWSDDFATRYAHEACRCADPGPCDENQIVATLHAPGVDVACVDAYTAAMQARTSCQDYTAPMPTCEITPGAAAARYARAVCACQDRAADASCFDNAYHEVLGGDPACLLQGAIGYESDCTGRSGPGCAL